MGKINRRFCVYGEAMPIFTNDASKQVKSVEEKHLQKKIEMVIKILKDVLQNYISQEDKTAQNQRYIRNRNNTDNRLSIICEDDMRTRREMTSIRNSKSRYEKACKESENAYAQRNPHKRKK